MSASEASTFEELFLESNDQLRTADLKSGVVSIDYYEDILSPTVTAKVRVINTGDSIAPKDPNDPKKTDGARQSTYSPSELVVKTSWWEIDNVFYEARGTAWALVHFLKAVEVDFVDVLEKKNALASLQQIIRELEMTQQPIHSPMIVNGEGFGLLANHSLVMASYISRANAAIIDLRELLSKG